MPRRIPRSFWFRPVFFMKPQLSFSLLHPIKQSSLLRELRMVLPLLAITVACSSNLLVPAAVAAPAAVVAPGGADYRLGVGDSIGITVSNHPDINSDVTVRPDGKISVAQAGDVAAVGKTTKQLAAQIETILARTLNNARVQVILKTAAARQASILGAVNKPAIYDIKPNSRVLDLIAAAGGLNTKPNRVSGSIVRNGAIIRFDLPEAFNKPGGSSNVAIKPGDLLQLEARDFTKQLTVTGNVAAPGAFDLRENLTVPELLAQAGGVRAGAALKRAHILREGKVISLDLSEAQSGNLSPNSPLNTFEFQPGDVLVVPENTDSVNVMGQVARPSSYPLSEDAMQKSILNVLAQAGGPSENADLSKVSLTRNENGQPTTTTINVKAMRDGTAPDNVFLKDNDALFVPKYDARVTVTGPVDKPGSYPIEEGQTLLSLLAQAGNPSRDAGLRKAYILRDGVQIPVDLYPALVEGAIDPEIAGFRLQSGDGIYIPDTSDQVTITGAVTKPGPYSLTDDLTVVSLLARAGNQTSDAALNKAYVIRKNVPIPLDLNVFLSGDTSQPSLTGFRLKPGDTLVVPENKVFYAVLGQVKTPNKFAYPDNPADANVLRALVNAGGPISGTGGADLKDAVLVRDINGQRNVVPINLNELFKPKKNKKPEEQTQNLLLLPGDVLFVPAKGRGFQLGDLLGAASVFNLIR